MLYEVNGHALLPAGLDGEQLRQQAAVAERVLGLRGAASVVFTGPEADDAARAVALQVALQDAADPESYLLESVGRGSETMGYRTDPETGSAVLLHPVAVAIVEQLYGELEGEAEEDEDSAWPVMGPWRVPSGPPR